MFTITKRWRWRLVCLLALIPSTLPGQEPDGDEPSPTYRVSDDEPDGETRVQVSSRRPSDGVEDSKPIVLTRPRSLVEPQANRLRALEPDSTATMTPLRIPRGVQARFSDEEPLAAIGEDKTSMQTPAAPAEAALAAQQPPPAFVPLSVRPLSTEPVAETSPHTFDLDSAQLESRPRGPVHDVDSDPLSAPPPMAEMPAPREPATNSPSMQRDDEMPALSQYISIQPARGSSARSLIKSAAATRTTFDSPSTGTSQDVLHEARRADADQKLDEHLGRAFPRSRVVLELRDNEVIIRGEASSQEEASRILSHVRGERLIPVVDQLKVRKSLTPTTRR